MKISIIGGTKSQKKYVRSITKYVTKKLMPRMHSLEVSIRLRSFGKDDAYGYCLPSDEADLARPRQFNIEINSKLKLRVLLETLAHELVHAKQFARGELYQSTVTMRHRWQGTWMPAKLPNYWDQPWEIEAHGREAGLFVRWCEAERIGHLKWTQHV